LAVLPLKFGELFGILLFYIWGSRRKIAINNIEKSSLGSRLSAFDTAKKSFQNLGRSIAEIIKIYYGLGSGIIDSVKFEGLENFEKAKAKGKGILIITGHCGNWELMAIASSVKVMGVSGVARQINNPYINRFVEKTRQKYGNSIIYKKGALRGIIEKLREGGCVGILMDQAVLSDEGYVIDFLGRGAWTMKTPALIARKTGAAVLPAFIHRTANGHKIKIFEEIELSGALNKEDAVLEDTMRFSGFIESYIKEHPSEWLWIHRRWKRVN